MAHRDEVGVGGVHRARMAFFNHQQEFNKLSQQCMFGELTANQFMVALEELDKRLYAELKLSLPHAQPGGIDSEQPK